MTTLLATPSKNHPPFAVWKPSFVLGIPTVDAEHRRFLEMMNELYEAMFSGNSNGQLRSTHQNLAAYCDFHFSGEEELLAAVHFPGRAEHAKEHTWFTAQLHDLRLDRTDGSSAALVLMKDWFVDHILGTDKAFAVWIGANVSVAPVIARTYYPVR